MDGGADRYQWTPRLPLGQFAAEEDAYDRAAGAEQIAAKYRRFIEVYEGAGVAA